MPKRICLACDEPNPRKYNKLSLYYNSKYKRLLLGLSFLPSRPETGSPPTCCCPIAKIGANFGWLLPLNWGLNLAQGIGRNLGLYSAYTLNLCGQLQPAFDQFGVLLLPKFASVIFKNAGDQQTWGGSLTSSFDACIFSGSYTMPSSAGGQIKLISRRRRW